MADTAGGFDRRPPQARVRLRHDRVGHHPNVARFGIGRTERHRGVGIDRHRQPARHHRESGGRRGHEEAHGVGLGCDPVSRERRRGPEADLLFSDEARPAEFDPLDKKRPVLCRQPMRFDTRNGASRPRRVLVGRPDHHVIEVRQDVRLGLGVAQPPAAPIGDQQLFAEQTPRQVRQVDRKAPVFGQRRAQGVGDEIGVLAHGLQHADRAREARAVEFERIGLRAGNTAHHEIDRHQPVERLQRHPVARNAQVGPLHEDQAEVAREIGMAEEVVVVRPRREQRHDGIDAVRSLRQRRLHLLEVGREPQRLAGRKHVARHVGVHHPVGDGVADAGRRLRVRVDHAPGPVGRPRTVHGEELEEAASGKLVLAGAQVGGIGEDELVRDRPVDHQALRAISIGEDALEEARPLQKCLLQEPPLLGRDDERDEVDPPRLRRAGGVREQVVGDAGLAHPRVQTLRARPARRGIEPRAEFKERAPVGPQFPRRRHQLVEARQAGSVAVQQPAEPGRLCLPPQHVVCASRRFRLGAGWPGLQNRIMLRRYRLRCG